MKSERGHMARHALTAALSCLLAFSGTPAIAWAETFQDDQGAIVAQALPASFDLRTKGVVTPVKSQSPWGTCWAFGSIAAAETSILTDLGKTYKQMPLDLSERHLSWFALHAMTKEEDPEQVGEGLHMFGEQEGDINAAYNYGGVPLYVTTLFSTGVGPMLEKTYPYRGNNSLLESDALVLFENEWKAMQLDSVLAEYPGTTDADAVEFVDLYYQQVLESLTTSDYYSEMDDWSIPTLDKDGDSNRLVFSGYTLRDGNILPEAALRDDANTDVNSGVWMGVSEEGTNAIKSELMKGRGVAASYCADNSLPGGDETGIYMNLDNWAHYTYEDQPINHVVCIVGWDDDYPAKNFTHEVYDVDDAGNRTLNKERTKLTTPPGNGAWIVKNSWGSESDASLGALTTRDGTKKDENEMAWGIPNDKGEHTGYFYLSYYDKSLGDCESFDFDTDFDSGADASFLVWQHDFLPSQTTLWEELSVEQMSTANCFDVDEDAILTSVSARPGVQDATVRFDVYRLREGAKDPQDGEPIASCTKKFQYAGFHRVDLPEGVALKAGDRISVVTTVSTKDVDGTVYYDANASAGIDERSARAFDHACYSVAVVNPRESYIKSGDTWVDWAAYQQTDEFKETAIFRTDQGDLTCVVDNFAIKAYAQPATQEQPAKTTTSTQRPRTPAKMTVPTVTISVAKSAE